MEFKSTSFIYKEVYIYFWVLRISMVFIFRALIIKLIRRFLVAIGS